MKLEESKSPINKKTNPLSIDYCEEQKVYKEKPMTR
jgi:hypothetical protein